MGLFKTKQEKEVEQKMLARKAMIGMNKQLQQLEQAKTKYLEVAKKAQLSGNPAQINLAKTGLKMILNQIKMVQTMQMNFELASQMKDISSMTKDFLAGMSAISKEMSKTASGMEFEKVQKDFEMAMGTMDLTMSNMESLMDSSQQSFEAMTANGSAADDAELDELIQSMASSELGATSVAGPNISSRLEEVEKLK